MTIITVKYSILLFIATNSIYLSNDYILVNPVKFNTGLKDYVYVPNSSKFFSFFTKIFLYHSKLKTSV